MEYGTAISCKKQNFMTYNGNMLFHFTKFESALKIIATNRLMFGEFVNMNDISESRREIFDKDLEREIRLFKSLSFTVDNRNKRAFTIDSLWGYYAEKGNGVCLVFNKEMLINSFRTLDGFCRNGKIHYRKKFSNAIFPESTSYFSAQKEIERRYKDIFFTKSFDWKTENEYRFLIRPNTKSLKNLNFADSLIAIILCLPLCLEIKETAEYKILKRQTKKPILRYTTKLGNKELWKIETDELLWPIIGIDYFLDV